MSPEPNGDVGFELVREGEIPQARAIPRALLRDSRISFGAKGLFVFLWDLPVGWRIRLVHLSDFGPQRRDAVRSLIAELEAVGAVRGELVRDGAGRLQGKRWILRSPHLWASETPLSKRTDSGKPEIGLPGSGKSGSKVLTKEVFSSSATSPPKKSHTVFDVGPAGIHVWTPVDRAAADELVASHSLGEIAAAIEALERAGQEPLPGRVRRILAQRARHRKAQVRQVEEPPKPRTPEVAQAGLKAVKALLAGAEAPCAEHFPTP